MNEPEKLSVPGVVSLLTSITSAWEFVMLPAAFKIAEVIVPCAGKTDAVTVLVVVVGELVKVAVELSVPVFGATVPVIGCVAGVGGGAGVAPRTAAGVKCIKLHVNASIMRLELRGDRFPPAQMPAKMWNTFSFWLAPFNSSVRDFCMRYAPGK